MGWREVASAPRVENAAKFTCTCQYSRAGLEQQVGGNRVDLAFLNRANFRKTGPRVDGSNVDWAPAPTRNDDVWIGSDDLTCLDDALF